MIGSLFEKNMGTCVKHDIPLMEAGVDSLAASELVQAIEGEFEVELSATLLFDHPSIASISSHISFKSQICTVEGSKELF